MPNKVGWLHYKVLIGDTCLHFLLGETSPLKLLTNLVAQSMLLYLHKAIFILIVPAGYFHRKKIKHIQNSFQRTVIKTIFLYEKVA